MPARAVFVTYALDHDPLLALADRKSAFMLSVKRLPSNSDNLEADGAPLDDVIQ